MEKAGFKAFENVADKITGNMIPQILKTAVQ